MTDLQKNGNGIKPKVNNLVSPEEQKILCEVTVLFNYNPSDGDELTIKKGEKIQVLKTSPDQWHTGILNGKIGLFPSTYTDYVDVSKRMNNSQNKPQPTIPEEKVSEDESESESEISDTESDKSEGSLNSEKSRMLTNAKMKEEFEDIQNIISTDTSESQKDNEKQKSQGIEKRKKRSKSSGNSKKKERRRSRRHSIKKDKEDWFIDYNRLIFGERLSAGSFGTVFVGKLKVGIGFIDVAIKELKETDYHSLKNEVQLMKKVVSHPNILMCYGACQGKNNYYIITKFQKNGDLVDFYKKKKITKIKKLKLLLKLAKTMKWLHDKEIIHRDLKPENVLIKDDLDICLCDFGGSKAESFVNRTLAGTAIYLDPQYLDNENDIVPRMVDIYSFGVICWELFSEKKPFSNYVKEHKQNQFHLLFKIHSNKLRPDVKMIKDKAPEELIVLAEDCWNADLNLRPQSFGDIVKRLKKIYKKERKKGKSK